MKKQTHTPTLHLMCFMAVVTLIFGAVIGGISHYATQQTPLPQKANTVKELKRVLDGCRMDGWNPSIVTIWSAPVGQPRRPVEWVVTCTPSPEDANENP